MDAYDQIRRENQMEQQRRCDEVHHTVPEIRAIDEKIAHISVESAKHMVFHPEDDCREALRNEIYDLSMERVNLLAIHQYPADYLDSIYQCPLCRDTGYIGTEKCQCFKQRIAALLSRESNLQELSREANFSLFRLDYYSEERDPGNMQQPSPRENMQHILRKCTDYIQRFSLDPGKNLLIFGNTGVGKTFLASCIATELLGQGNSVIYLTAHQFFDRLADYTFRREKENSDTLSTLLQCDLLIIDDLGTELNNGFINSQLFLCINERILHKKSTIISTNLSLKQLNRIYTERISSRIIENYEHLHIFGEDIRIKKAFSSLD
ncbi:MAG: ATP-binding protein, partial [Clostridiales bacterium]|nr:ATP-binding protein [Clostridiales bacterium]